MAGKQNFSKIKPYRGEETESLAKAEKMAFVACIISVAGAPLGLLGVGMFLSVAALYMAIKAKRPNGTRPVSGIIAIICSIIGIILSVPGWIVIYGTYINPGSPFVQNLVNTLFGVK